MTDQCDVITLNVILQENGIIRNSHGLLIGRLTSDNSFTSVKTIEDAGYMPVDEIGTNEQEYQMFMLSERRDPSLGDDDSLDTWDDIGISSNLNAINRWVELSPYSHQYRVLIDATIT